MRPTTNPAVLVLVTFVSAMVGAVAYVVMFVRHHPSKTATAPSAASSIPVVDLSTAALAPTREVAPLASSAFVPIPSASVALATATHAEVATAWDGTKPFECGGYDDVTLTGVTATLDGEVAVSAAGACKLHLVRVHLKGRTAVYTAGHSEVVIDDSKLEGTAIALKATGGSHVVLHRDVFVGPVQRHGGATIDGQY